MKKAVCLILLFIGQLAMAETATFAAGCFWGVEEHYRKIPGVTKTRVGFIGGTLQNPKYEDTHDGKSGHAEAVEIEFDAKKVTFDQLMDTFFKFHDPTTLNRQGNDEGTQYRSGIYYHSEQQKKAAEAFIAKVNKSGAWKNKVVTEVVAATKFWSASEEHQKYLVKNPGGYDNHFMRKISFDSGSGK